jgi:hypothetical protein
VYVQDETDPAEFTVTRTGVTTGTASVQVSTGPGGTATAGSDYTPINAMTLNFAAGETSKVVPIALLGDLLYEADEVIPLRLHNPSGTGAGLGAQNTASFIINDTANQYRSDTAGIDIFQGAVAAPYPSNITVVGGPTNVHRVRVTLYDFYHNFPDNVDVLLVNPQGRKMVIMGDSGGANAISPTGHVTLTFTDNAGQVLPNSNPLTRGKFEPTTWEPTVGDFPPPAPIGPYNEPGSTVGGTTAQTFFGVFGQLDGNGTWSLYIRDDNGQPIAPEAIVGRVNRGWGLELLAATATNVSVSGRVVTPSGAGLRNATVYMTDGMGVTRSATTSSFGFYQFEDVEVGSTFVMSVASRRYRFTPRVVQVFDTLTDVDFIGQE